ncbi:hypothetical protein CON03_20625 [Bacillus cereus]|nr:hypothetical protein CON03_20625 [Bacillus cereus]PFS85422.1 hypothetical protein COK56_00490 [Bacillus cereus]
MQNVPYKVLLPSAFWREAKSKDEIKERIKQYFRTSYPECQIKKVIKENGSYIAICTRG